MYWALGPGVTLCYLRQGINDKVIVQTQEAHDGEQMNQDECEQSGQQDGATVKKS